MEQLIIKSSSNMYDIFIGEDIRHNLNTFLKKDYSSILIITDQHVAKLYLDDIKKSLKGYRLYEYIVPAGEKSKSLKQYEAIQTAAIENGLDRNSLLIALGGGVVGDLAGFVAATFMRGVEYIHMPTTILAHDSSVGGKVAINHNLGKNLIGSFYPPAAVLYDINTLTTLPQKEIRSGYAELIKEGLIANKHLFESILSEDLNALTSEKLTYHILEGIKVKAEIVEADEKEHGIRSYLNLGHTFAHALESELGYGEITHGEAVAIGLLFAIHVSEAIYKKELPFEKLASWIVSNQYPIHSITFNNEKIITRMKSDKKTINQQIKMVLLKEPGQLAVKEVSDRTMAKYLQTFTERLV